MTVQSGTATGSAAGTTLTITASQNATLNWQSFNINPGETTVFHQPSSSAIVWNRINDQNPSQIWGNLDANGIVVLMNPSGFFFGPNSMIHAASFVASTASGAAVDFGDTAGWEFSGPPVQASIVNYGQINVAHGGSAFLIAEHIENRGSISAPGGSVGLAAGGDVLVSSRPDGLGLSATVHLPSGSIDNSGRIIADGGGIAMTAQVVNQNGLVQADSVRNHDGVIELFASQSVNLGANSIIQASGGKTTGDGGQIEIKSSGSFFDTTSSRIEVTGGAQGGNGGQVEISAPVLPAIHSAIDGRAQSGFTGGKLTIDPTDIILSDSGTGSAGSGTVAAGSSSGTLTLDVNTAFTGFSQIDLQATHDITLSAGTTWDLGQSTGISTPGSKLTLEAGHDISIQDGASILAGAGWAVALQAGRDFSSPNTVMPGIGSITFEGSGSLQALDGNITLLAGLDVTVNSGFIRTEAGGNIDVTALAGSINTGTSANGFDFLPFGTGYIVDPNLGGISTASGGNVKLTAGLDVISYLPSPGGPITDAGSGAFGSAPGNVTISAGRDVMGHFVVADGTGTITAGHNAGTTTESLALSLVSGGWNVSAANDILLQEVRNPNGIFNDLGFSSSTSQHHFNYSEDAYTILNGGNSVQLLGSALPRNDDNFEQSIPPIYPGALQINAGAGGVILGNNVTLFPSPLGELNITTINGGSLVGTIPGDLAQLIMSDSGKTQYRATGDFGLTDHAAVPVQINNFNPVKLNISGDMNSVLLAVPKVAEITIGGNMINSRFQGQNLHAGDVTSISVAGDIMNRNDFTSVTVNQAPGFSVLFNVYPPFASSIAGLPGQFSYDAQTKTLIFEGRMTGEELQALLNLQVPVDDKFGQPIFDSQGNPVTQPAQFTSAAVLQQLFANSQDIPLNPNTGYLLGGGGQFNLTARNLDLGATTGIVSEGPLMNHALANYFTRGADINVSLSGNLDMFSTTISSVNGGAINIFAGGSINVGSSLFAGDNSVARGIFTVDPSDVTVIANGNINVNGSRIAAYDGGNIKVESLTGNVDTGNGGLGSVPVEKAFVDPVTRAIETYTPTIPGSGILATTFPPPFGTSFPASQATVGNIFVQTLQGNITANAGGITQIPLNGINTQAGTVTLNAGSADASGKVLFVGNIDASDSGVIGSTVNLHATGNIEGLLIGRNSINVSAVQNVNITALTPGSLGVSSGGTVSGTLIGVDSLSVSGTSVNASLLSQNISTSGTVTSPQIGFTPGTAASATSQSLQTGEFQSASQIATATNSPPENQATLAAALPHLTRTEGRVTVILPKK